MHGACPSATDGKRAQTKCRCIAVAVPVPVQRVHGVVVHTVSCITPVRTSPAVC